MLEDQNDCNENVLRRFDQVLPNGAAGHFMTFRMFDPAVMIDNGLLKEYKLLLVATTASPTSRAPCGRSFWY